MKKKVLLLEDSGFIYSALEIRLEENNYEVIDCVQISDAIDNFKTDIDYLIVDLNVPPTGLTKEQRDHTEGGLFSGWIWLKNYVLNKQPEYRGKVIIYSAFINQLISKFPSEIKGIKLMEKGKKTPSDVVDELKKM